MTQEELILDGKTYVSSKRAAQLSQYAQDYIGQMCRSGSADCRRVHGLWYVTMESLEHHKIASAEVKARAFESLPQEHQYNETVLSFSGEEYVSSKHGADATGYNPDYITQLARSGKVRARQIGSRWYVSRTDLLENKRKNDDLLATVQVESVGIQRTSEKSNVLSITRTELPLLNYKPDTAALMPINDDVRGTPISIRKKPYAPAKVEVGEPADAEVPGVLLPQNAPVERASKHKGAKTLVFAVTAVVFFGSLSFVGYVFLKDRYSGNIGLQITSVSAVLRENHPSGFVDMLLMLATDVVTYRRSE